MSWFHFNKQERLQRQRTIRRELAEQARKDALDNPWIIGRAVGEAFKLASVEEQLFADYFGEPMPSHVLAALRFEQLLWHRIQAALEKADAAHMTEHKYAALRDGICALLLCLINVLHAEEEMLTTCLVRHYLELLQRLQADAARVTL
jgi:hypothetical protein